MHTDVIIAADGVHSSAHEHIIGQLVPATPNGIRNVRFVLETQSILDDPVTAKITDNGNGCAAFYWARDQKSFIMRYPCRNNELQNFGAYSLPGAPTEGHQVTGDQTRREDLIKLLSSQPPEIAALAHKTEEVLYNWIVMDREPSSTYQKSQVVLVGDAAHPMATFQGQGGAQSIEDGAVLGVLLNQLDNRSSIPDRLRLYDDLRIRRTFIAQITSRVTPSEKSTQEALPDGLVKLYPPNSRPTYWYEAADWLWDHDCIEEATKALEQHLRNSTTVLNGMGGA